jgi:hypothetical protein
LLGCGTALDELSVVDISEGINEGCVVLDMITGSPELVVLLEGRAVLFTKVVEYGTLEVCLAVLMMVLMIMKVLMMVLMKVLMMILMMALK